MVRFVLTTFVSWLFGGELTKEEEKEVIEVVLATPLLRRFAEAVRGFLAYVSNESPEKPVTRLSEQEAREYCVFSSIIDGEVISASTRQKILARRGEAERFILGDKNRPTIDLVGDAESGRWWYRSEEIDPLPQLRCLLEIICFHCGSISVETIVDEIERFGYRSDNGKIHTAKESLSRYLKDLHPDCDIKFGGGRYHLRNINFFLIRPKE